MVLHYLQSLPQDVPLWVAVIGLLSTFVLGVFGKGTIGQYILNKQDMDAKCRQECAILKKGLSEAVVAFSIIGNMMSASAAAEAKSMEMEEAARQELMRSIKKIEETLNSVENVQAQSN